jgi:hypothetical protein
MPKGPQGRNIALGLWCLTIVLLVVIPARYWDYPSDLWLRIVVMLPALAAATVWLNSQFGKKDA